MISQKDIFGYSFNKSFSKSVAYFSMEFAIDQSLKIYSGGLGFLAGSHMRSAYELKQNLLGIGMLWKYGYYDQVKGYDGSMKPEYVEKRYSFLEDTGIVFPVEVHSSTVYVKAFLLKPTTFNSAPIFLLSTDIDQNDSLSRTITNRLYDSNESTRIAQSIVLGIGGAKLLDILEMKTDIYHMNEGHALPLTFFLYSKYKELAEVQKRVVFTTHTPELAGNEEHDFGLLNRMSFFNGVDSDEIKTLLKVENNRLNYTLSALRFAKVANGVSQLHGEVAREMWYGYEGVCEIKAITNSQNKNYWQDEAFAQALKAVGDKELIARKKELKSELFKEIANQTGKIFDENVLTLVWARRYAGYKRADLITHDLERFKKLLANAQYPIQIIWAGKPYPEDHGAIDTFNSLWKKTLSISNCAVLTGYELSLSALIKKGSDVWLNNPKMYREASGTSGMTAAMNGCVNFSIPDGWIPEFSKHAVNSYIINPAQKGLNEVETNAIEASNMLDVLENEILPTYYDSPTKWNKIVRTAVKDVIPAFESGRMAEEYYNQLFNTEVKTLSLA